MSALIPVIVLFFVMYRAIRLMLRVREEQGEEGKIELDEHRPSRENSGEPDKHMHAGGTVTRIAPRVPFGGRKYITVEFTVKGEMFSVTEPLRYCENDVPETENVFSRLSRHNEPLLGFINVGDDVVICYDPQDPDDAFIRDNVERQSIRLS